MPYSTKADLIRQYGAELIKQLADRDNSGDADNELIDGAIAQADAMIDGYLRIGYSVPLATAPDEIKAASMAIAFYKLWTSERPLHVRQDFEDTRAYLRDLSLGKASLSDPTIAPATSGGVAGLALADPDDDRTFSRSTLADFISQ